MLILSEVACTLRKTIPEGFQKVKLKGGLFFRKVRREHIYSQTRYLRARHV